MPSLKQSLARKKGDRHTDPKMKVTEDEKNSCETGRVSSPQPSSNLGQGSGKRKMNESESENEPVRSRKLFCGYPRWAGKIFVVKIEILREASFLRRKQSINTLEQLAWIHLE